MKERLSQLLTHFGYTATKFADEIGVQRSGISHILSGRNQPGYDFIVKTLNKFPDIDAEWFIMGKGKMFKVKNKDSDTAVGSRNHTINTPVQPDLFSTLIENKIQKQANQDNLRVVTSVTYPQRVVILNSDGTFDLYNQAKKD